jgi:deoxyribonuclease IV
MQKNRLLLGAHLSIAGGYDQAIVKGDQIGCTAIQIFTQSNRQWAIKAINQKQVSRFKEALKTSSCSIVVSHASYLINICSPDPAIHQKSTQALQEELNRCSALGIPYLVLHPGTATNSSLEQSLQRASQTLTTVLKEDRGSTMILLENSAGQGASVGKTFEELAAIANHVEQQSRIGFCFDTCHAFAAGYNFATLNQYEQMWNHFNALIGLERLKAFHCNDSAKELGSRVDRHAHIGQGKIGLDAFSFLMNDPRFFAIPKILETPKSETDLSDDVKNMETLKKLLSAQTKDLLLS